MLSGRYRRRQESPEANPMDGVGNMADAMLVLAVGIMLALILNWNVDISKAAGAYEAPETDEALTFTDEDLSQSESQTAGEGDLKKLGAVYYDEESGTYYIIEEETP